MSRRLEARVARTLAVALVVLAALVAAEGLERRNTWYLASDQFAFLTSAADLTHGRLLHSTELLERLAPPWSGAPRDALYQTYFWSGDRLYSRYPPGFPALLAAAGMVGGEVAQHALNPALFLALLVVLASLCWATLRAHDRSLAAAAAVAAVWLLLLLPTQLHLWGITVARDLPAHLLAFGALLATVTGLPWLAGLLLGLACTVRPDAILYGASIAAIFAVRRVGVRDPLRLGLGLVLGCAPLLLYNLAIRGHLFSFTQSGEFDRVLSRWSTSPFVVLAQVGVRPSGGGFRLANLATTLPGCLALLGHAFSWSIVLALVAIAWSVRVRPVLAATFVPYVVLALPFYACWSHPDARYLAGISLMLLALVAAGAVVACRRVADPAAPVLLRIATTALAALVAVAALVAPGERGPLVPGAPEVALGAAIVVVGLLSFARAPSGGLQSAVLAPGLALAVVGLLRFAQSEGGRDPFQRPQVDRARATVEALVPEGALVLVGDRLGRPAENIAHYTHATSYYAAELPLLRTDPKRAALRYARSAHRVFVLAADGDRELVQAFAGETTLRSLEHRSGSALYDWFVDPRAAGSGAVLYEVVVAPAAVPAGPPAGAR